MEVKIESIYQLGLSFFGLTSDVAHIVRANLFTQIHEIVFHGKGGYDWNTIYEMPRWLRQFTFNKMQEFYNKENEEYEKASKGSSSQTLIDSSGKVNKENWKNIVTPDSSKPKIKYK